MTFHLPEAYLSREARRPLTPWNAPVLVLVPGTIQPVIWIPAKRDCRLPVTRYIDHRGRTRTLSKSLDAHIRGTRKP